MSRSMIEVIEDLRKENAELKDKLRIASEDKIVEEFTNRISKTLMNILANIPYSQWPDPAKRAFNLEGYPTPTAAHLYRTRLPKKKD